MMFTFRRRSALKLLFKKHIAEPAVPPPDADEVKLQHLDYDLQPLQVESLSHYIEPALEQERFRVH